MSFARGDVVLVDEPFSDRTLRRFFLPATMDIESDLLATSIADLASAIESNTQEMKALRDAVDDLRTEYQYAVRNSECPYLTEAAVAAERHPDRQLELIAELIRLSITEGFLEAVDRLDKKRPKPDRDKGHDPLSYAPGECSESEGEAQDDKGPRDRQQSKLF